MLRSLFAFVITLLTGWGAIGADDNALPAYDVTGDVLGGVLVISALNANALPMGRHHFYFKAGSNSNGQPLYVPVIVLRGANTGKRLVLTAAVHGDELNGIAVIHRLIKDIKLEAFSGTLIALPGVNQTGLVGNNRHFLSSASGGIQVDPNRIFPGSIAGGGPAERFIGAVWDGILKNNADLAVDLHTQTTGSEYPLFVFADFRNPKAYALAFALMPDLIKNDSGQEGTLETTYLKAEIPAVTLEIGAPKEFQSGLIDRAVTGLRNIMVVEGMLEGERQRPTKPPFVGSSYTNVEAEEAGTALVKVKLLDSVKKGQLLAIVYDPFGQEIRRYFAPHDGRVLSIATDPLREAGSMLVRILR